MKLDKEANEQVRELLETSRDAALGTLADGAPFVSLVLFAVSSDLAYFIVHLSKLALHTRNILSDPRVGLLIRARTAEEVDPQTVRRISVHGRAVPIDPETDEFENTKSTYLSRHPQAARNFELGDFVLFKVEPLKARYVGGFGKILDLGQDDFRRLIQS